MEILRGPSLYPAIKKAITIYYFASNWMNNLVNKILEPDEIILHILKFTKTSIIYTHKKCKLILKKNQNKEQQDTRIKFALFKRGSNKRNLIGPHQSTSIAQGPGSVRPTPHHRC